MARRGFIGRVVALAVATLIAISAGAMVASAGASAASRRLSIARVDLPIGNISRPYFARLSARGGVRPFTWSLRSGRLPTGLLLNRTSGFIMGTPLTAGGGPVVIQVTDAERHTATATVDMLVQGEAEQKGDSGDTGAASGHSAVPDHADPPDPPSAVTDIGPDLTKGSHNGGRVNALAISPANPLQVFAASENGGLWQSSDGGNTWSHVDSVPFWQANDVAIAASDPNLIIATGNYDGRIPSQGGIWRSTDGGATWSKPATSDPSCTTESSAFGIAIAPGTPGSLQIWVGDSCGVAYSSDSGATWSHFALPGVSGNVWDVTVRPSASTFQVDACGDNGVSQSTSGGASAGAFAALTDPVPSGGFGPCSIATAPQNPQILFTTHYKGVSSAGFCEPQFQQSTDGGTTWVDMGPSNDNCRQPWVVTHPDIAGNSTKFEVYEGTGQQLVYQRCDATTGCQAGTAHWTTITSGSHADTSDIVFDPSVPNGCPLLLSSDGGVYRTTVPSASCASTYAWTDSTSGLHAFEATGLAGTVNPASTDLYFGTQDNGIYYTGNQGATYTEQGPDVYNVYADSSSPPAARVLWRSCFGCGVSIGGAGLSSPSAFSLPPGYDVPDNFEATQFGHQSYAFITSDGAESGSTSAGPNWKMEITTNAGSSWAQMGSDPLPGVGPAGPLQAAGPSSSPTFYWLLNNGGGSQIESLSGPFNSTATAADASSSLQDPSTFAVDPSNPDLLYAYDLTSAGGEVMRSVDGGATWTEDVAISNLVTLGGQFNTVSNAGPLVQYIAFDPTSKTIMIDALSGVFYSLDGGTSWSILSGGQQLNNASGFFFDNRTKDIDLAMYGRGLWQISPLTAVATSLSGGGQTGTTVTVPLGTATSDSATLSGTNTASATGTVTYNVYSDPSCTALAGTGGTVTVTGGVVPPSSPVTQATPGTYYWQASYSGDASNAPSQSNCGSEIEHVQAPTTLTTSLFGGGPSGPTIFVLPGTAVTDSATLSGVNASTAGGTVTYNVYSDPHCTTPVVTGLPETITTPGVLPPSAPVTLSATGSYYWQASYSGDTANEPSASTCGLEVETVISAAPGGGSFVIGNGNSAMGASVTFWGAQWSKQNPLSGGPAPAAFKGYAPNPVIPSCGAQWTASPGNSASPPAGPLPALMAVVVSSTVTRSHSTITGNVIHIVVVQTNKGYQPNPGHKGTGTIVGQVC